MNIFIAGARVVKNLDSSVNSKLNSIYEKGYNVIVGDADGVDSSVQRFYSDLGYKNVTVFAGNGRASLDVNNLSVNVAGASDFTLTGNAEKAYFTLAGAGRIEALELQTQTTNVNLAGAGTVRISASEKLTISAGGVGTVEYRGSPTLDISRGGLVSVRNVN